MKTKKKTVYELECEFIKHQKNTLQDLLIMCYKKFPKIIDRKFEKRDTIYWGINYHNENKEYFAFQFCMCSNGESSNIFTNTNANKEKVKLETLSPPDNSDFSDGDIICLVKKNTLYVCCSQIRWQQVYYYLKELFIKSKICKKDTLFFTIIQPVKRDLLEKILQERVQEIFVELSTSTELSPYKESNSTIIQMVMSALKQLKTKKEVLNESLPLTKLSLKTGRNNIKWINGEMKDIVESPLTYKIITKKGTTITPDIIKITYTIYPSVNGKSVNFDDTIKKINEKLKL